MKVGLLDVDGHNFPNLALMKLSSYHKQRGDAVEQFFPLAHYDMVYKSKVFTFTADFQYATDADTVIQGGTGYGLDNKLPDEIEHIMPDYSLYGIKGIAYGFLTRGCPRACGFCIVSPKEGRCSKKVADLKEFMPENTKLIKLLDPNLLACTDHIELLEQLAASKTKIDFTQGLDARLLNDENILALNKCRVAKLHFAWDFMEQSESVLEGLKLYSKLGAVQDVRKRIVYVLTNYNTTHEQDLYRIYKLRELSFDPYVMIYDKQNAPKQTRRLQRWVNSKFIFRSCERFEDYK